MTTNSFDRLPEYLKAYTSTQDYEHYTGREQATWRYILRRFEKFFAENAVPVYNAGLAKTGISIEAIPRVQEMDKKLNEFGWGAVTVEGFIPSPVFLDLLSRGIMPIARDMRSVDHIGYTPAPDIVHEAAGHAPIVADKDYRYFLESYAKAAYRAVMSDEDIRLYEAIRLLSDIKERPMTPQTDIQKAERALTECAASISYTSEAAQVGRMAWWTIEYGLCGSLDKPKIYGAGLLSSLSESKNCLTSKVKKIPLSIACIDQAYDITEPQPQLYVTPHLSELPRVLHELEDKLSFKRGGVFALNELKRARTLNSVEFESGLQVSGILEDFVFDSVNAEASILLFKGAKQWGVGDKEFAQDRSAKDLNELALLPFGANSLGKITSTGLILKDPQHVVVGKTVDVTYNSGVVVKGTVRKLTRGSQTGLLAIDLAQFEIQIPDRLRASFKNFSSVTLKGENLVLGFGANILSGFSGPCDRSTFGAYRMGKASTSPGRTIPYTDTERDLFKLYDTVRDLRSQILGPGLQTKEAVRSVDVKLQEMRALQTQKFVNEWLIAEEISELESKIVSCSAGLLVS